MTPHRDRGRRRRWVLGLGVLGVSIAPAGPREAAAGPRDEVAAVLDGLHEAASRADGRRYFALFAEDAVFMGTDAAERWSLAQFKAYAGPHFAKGKGWTYAPKQRHISVSPDGRTAWFDEMLDNAAYGTCRGSGVLVRRGGTWKLAQYNLGVPIPNALLPEVARMIKDETGNPEFHDVTARAAESLVARHRGKPGFLVLDVRTPGEFSGGRIAGALNVDFQGADFGQRLAALGRGQTYLVHCAAGGRSAKAVGRMRELGFRRVYHMTDGFNAWQKAGLPVER